MLLFLLLISFTKVLHGLDDLGTRSCDHSRTQNYYSLHWVWRTKSFRPFRTSSVCLYSFPFCLYFVAKVPLFWGQVCAFGRNRTSCSFFLLPQKYPVREGKFESLAQIVLFSIRYMLSFPLQKYLLCRVMFGDLALIIPNRSWCFHFTDINWPRTSQILASEMFILAPNGWEHPL